jgi:cytochrome c oxidase subunit 2
LEEGQSNKSDFFNNNRNLIIIIVGFIIVVIVAGFIFAKSRQDIIPQNQTQVPASQEESSVSVDGEVKEFDMTAKQWEFDPPTITVSQGDLVRLNISSIDVSHGFAIPEFGVNQRLEPNNTATVEFSADKKGTFRFFCSVICGAGHSDMSGTLVVE